MDEEKRWRWECPTCFMLLDTTISYCLRCNIPTGEGKRCKFTRVHQVDNTLDPNEAWMCKACCIPNKPGLNHKCQWCGFLRTGFVKAEAHSVNLVHFDYLNRDLELIKKGPRAHKGISTEPEKVPALPLTYQPKTTSPINQFCNLKPYPNLLNKNLLFDYKTAHIPPNHNIFGKNKEVFATPSFKINPEASLNHNSNNNAEVSLNQTLEKLKDFFNLSKKAGASENQSLDNNAEAYENQSLDNNSEAYENQIPDNNPKLTKNQTLDNNAKVSDNQTRVNDTEFAYNKMMENSNENQNDHSSQQSNHLQFVANQTSIDEVDFPETFSKSSKNGIDFEELSSKELDLSIDSNSQAIVHEDQDSGVEEKQKNDEQICTNASLQQYALPNQEQCILNPIFNLNPPVQTLNNNPTFAEFQHPSHTLSSFSNPQQQKTYYNQISNQCHLNQVCSSFDQESQSMDMNDDAPIQNHWPAIPAQSIPNLIPNIGTGSNNLLQPQNHGQTHTHHQSLNLFQPQNQSINIEHPQRQDHDFVHPMQHSQYPRQISSIQNTPNFGQFGQDLGSLAFHNPIMTQQNSHNQMQLNGITGRTGILIGGNNNTIIVNGNGINTGNLIGIRGTNNTITINNSPPTPAIAIIQTSILPIPGGRVPTHMQGRRIVLARRRHR